MADKWRYEEGIIHLEARAVLKGIERLARSQHGHDARALFVGDNLALSLALGRSRSRDFKLLTLIRRAGSLALARGLRLVFRWVPSELNSSDKGSRLFDENYDKKKDATWIVSCVPGSQGKDGVQKLLEPTVLGDARAAGSLGLGTRISRQVQAIQSMCKVSERMK